MRDYINGIIWVVAVVGGSLLAWYIIYKALPG